MTARPFLICALAMVMATASMSSLPSADQRLPASPEGGQPAAATARDSRRYVPPRTPWGDPDLQGVFTNKYEQRTPLERPPEFEGRRLEDVTGAELAAVLKARVFRERCCLTSS